MISEWVSFEDVEKASPGRLFVGEDFEKFLSLRVSMIISLLQKLSRTIMIYTNFYETLPIYARKQRLAH